MKTAERGAYGNATFSPRLTEAENRFFQHILMWGSRGYPVQKIGRRWQWVEFCGVKGAPTVYRTKSACVAAIELYLSILRDKYAGRL